MSEHVGKTYLSFTGEILTVAETPGMSTAAAPPLLAPAEGPLPEAATAAASGKTAPAAALFKALLFPLYIRNAMVSHAAGIKMSNL